ncbi:MAG: asparagine synthase (glutamine-hydrolyzing) [Terriglobales bacterium]|jgi:asparagine synthase (glutamine-hydrolysing)
MCGIMGMFGDGRVEEMAAGVRSMMAALRHRGPDAEASVEIAAGDTALMLGHTRLSILDLSAGSAQPIKHAETGSWLIYNGEIYNFRELRSELERLGFRFQTSGDTEVLLHALVAWGETALSRLEGMFAFAFWDGRERTLLLARDAMGIKPLYFYHDNSPHGQTGTRMFAFASEVKALERAQICPMTLDEDAVDSFLTFGAVIGPNTIRKEIRELQPGHWLCLNARLELTERQYWSLADAANDESQFDGTFEGATSLIRKRLEHAVSAQLVSDVPLGVFLSGGVDSSLLALLASQFASGPITLMTVAFPEQEFSELPYAREIAQGLPHPHQVVTLSATDLQRLLPDALAAMDQPTVDGINTYVISRAGADCGLKVLLTGIGGDELFGGYTTFVNAPRLLKYGAGLRRVARLMGKLGTKNPIPWKKVADAGELGNLAEAYLLQRSIRWRRGKSAAIAERMQASIDPFDNDFQKIAALELEFYARNQLLRDADVFSMANSVELRVPFLDLALAKAALSIAPKHHFAGGRGKRITRNLLAELAGERVAQRRKMGFTFPWRQWLQKTLRETIADTLRDEQLYEPLMLNPEYGRDLLDGLERDDRLQSWSEVWSLFTLLHWQARSGVDCAVA